MKRAGNKKEGQILKNLLSVKLLAVILIPCIIVLFSLFTKGDTTWNHIKKVLMPTYISDTLILTISVIFFTTIIGVGSAYFISRYDFPLRNFLDFTLILPMAIPGYVAAIVYSGILDYTGPVQSFLRNNLGVEAGTWKIFDIMNLGGAIFIITITLYPYIYVPVKNAFNTYALSYIEPSISLGIKYPFFKIILPIALPAILGGASLVLMEVLNEFGVVNYFGIEVFQTGIFRAWYALGNLNAAMKLSSYLLIFAVFAIVIEKLMLRNRKFNFSNRVLRPVKRVKAKGFKGVLIFLFTFTPFILGFLIPVLQLIFWFFKSYNKILDKEFISLLINSFTIAGTAVIISLIFSSMAAVVNNSRLPKILRKTFNLITIGYAIPGSVIAVGILILFGKIDSLQSTIMLSGTFFALIYAYNIRFMAVAYRPINAGLVTVNTKYREASRSLGVSKLKTLFRVDLALLKKSFLVSSILLFVDLLKELPLTMILRPFNFDTLATKIYELAGDEQIPESAVPALILILAGIIPIYILNRLSEKHSGTKTKKIK